MPIITTVADPDSHSARIDSEAERRPRPSRGDWLVAVVASPALAVAVGAVLTWGHWWPSANGKELLYAIGACSFLTTGIYQVSRADRPTRLLAWAVLSGVLAPLYAFAVFIGLLAWALRDCHRDCL
jgi:hypothetical protein